MSNFSELQKLNNDIESLLKAKDFKNPSIIKNLKLAKVPSF